MFFYNNIGYFVGSAKEKLNQDLDRCFEKDNKQLVLNPKTLSSLLKDLQNNSRSQSITQSLLDFTFVRINCKKEFKDQANNEKSSSSSFKNEIKNSSILTWLLRIIVLLTIVLIATIVVYLILDRRKSYDSANLKQFYQYGLYAQRRAGRFSGLKYDTDWTGENIPTIYELDALNYLNKKRINQTTSLNLIETELENLSRNLKINCFLIKNVIDFDRIDSKIGTISKLKTIVDNMRDRSIKIILDIDLSGTSKKHELYSKARQDFYLKNNVSNKKIIFKTF